MDSEDIYWLKIIFKVLFTFVTCEFDDTTRFGRFMTGLKKALTVLHRTPSLTVSWEEQYPTTLNIVTMKEIDLEGKNVLMIIYKSVISLH